ncbi:MAG: hypothetical protein ACRDRU_09885 [Pseudonocardiaceae bacterium]
MVQPELVERVAWERESLRGAVVCDVGCRRSTTTLQLAQRLAPARMDRITGQHPVDRPECPVVGRSWSVRLV